MIQLFENWDKMLKFAPIGEFSYQRIFGTRIEGREFSKSKYFETFLSVLDELEFFFKEKRMNLSIEEINKTPTVVIEFRVDNDEDYYAATYLNYMYMYDPVSPGHWEGRKEYTDVHGEIHVSSGPMSPNEFVGALHVDRVISAQDYEYAKHSLRVFDIANKYGV